MTTNKLPSGSQLPEITLSLVTGGEVNLGKPQKEGNWQLIFIALFAKDTCRNLKA